MNKLTYKEDAGNATIDIEGLIIYQLQEKYGVDVDIESKEWGIAIDALGLFIESKCVTGDYKNQHG